MNSQSIVWDHRQKHRTDLTAEEVQAAGYRQGTRLGPTAATRHDFTVQVWERAEEQPGDDVPFILEVTPGSRSYWHPVKNFGHLAGCLGQLAPIVAASGGR